MFWYDAKRRRQLYAMALTGGFCLCVVMALLARFAYQEPPTRRQHSDQALRSSEQNPALIAAVKAGDLDQAGNLLEQGADPNITDSTGRPVITLVTEPPVIGMIFGEPVHGPGQTITKHKNHAAMVRLLVQHGAKVKVKDTNGWTPLLQAQASEETDLVRFLEEAGTRR